MESTAITVTMATFWTFSWRGESAEMSRSDSVDIHKNVADLVVPEGRVMLFLAAVVVALFPLRTP